MLLSAAPWRLSHDTTVLLLCTLCRFRRRPAKGDLTLIRRWRPRADETEDTGGDDESAGRTRGSREDVVTVTATAHLWTCQVVESCGVVFLIKARQGDTVWYDSRSRTPSPCHGPIAPPTLAPPGELCWKRSVGVKESVVWWSVSIARREPTSPTSVWMHINVHKFQELRQQEVTPQKRHVVVIG